MSDVQAILTRAQKLGLRLQVEGERIAIAPARLCPAELLATIREHKPEVMSLLEARAYRLPPDAIPWLHVARQILAGEFGGADPSTVQSLTIGLRGIRHPLCQQALARLKGKG
jgi:TubC N-terminal docking domain